MGGWRVCAPSCGAAPAGGLLRQCRPPRRTSPMHRPRRARKGAAGLPLPGESGLSNRPDACLRPAFLSFLTARGHSAAAAAADQARIAGPGLRAIQADEARARGGLTMAAPGRHRRAGVAADATPAATRRSHWPRRAAAGGLWLPQARLVLLLAAALAARGAAAAFDGFSSKPEASSELAKRACLLHKQPGSSAEVASPSSSPPVAQRRVQLEITELPGWSGPLPSRHFAGEARGEPLGADEPLGSSRSSPLSLIFVSSGRLIDRSIAFPNCLKPERRLPAGRPHAPSLLLSGAERGRPLARPPHAVAQVRAWGGRGSAG